VALGLSVALTTAIGQQSELGRRNLGGVALNLLETIWTRWLDAIWTGWLPAG
jgi:hypothetical protein